MRVLGKLSNRLTRKFDEQPLYVRFALAFTLPVLVIVWVSISNILELRQAAAQLSRLNSNLQIVVAAGQLVGALQQERGYSVLWLKSSEQRFSDKLQRSRMQTEQSLRLLQQQLSRSSPQNTHSVVYQNVQEVLRMLSGRVTLRQRLDARAVAENAVLEFFTAPIIAFNNQISRLSRDVTHPDFARQLNAYFILNRLRELLGQERVLIGSVLTERQLTAADVRELIYLTGRQRSLLIGLKNQTKKADALSLAAVGTGIRNQLLLEEPPNEVLKNTQVSTWFEQQTQLIEQVKNVENNLVTELTQSAAEHYSRAQNELWRYAIISPMALFASFILAGLIFRFVKRRLLLSDKVFTHSHDRITVTDAGGNIVDVNPAFTRMTGYSKQEVLGKNPRFLQSGQQDTAFYRAMWQGILADGFWQGQLWNRRKDGSLYAEQSSISAIRDHHGEIQNFIAVSSDVTERAIAHQRELEYQAYHDALTGLPNVMLIRDRLEHAIDLARRDDLRVVVAAFDIDDFKGINERFGHVVGDTIIELMAKRLRSLLRDEDTLGRVTGDEFIFIIEGGEQHADTDTLLERIREHTANPMTIKGRRIKVTASIGATAYPDDNHDADTLIRHASQALHIAKRKGRDQVNWFDAQQEREQTQLTQLIKSLRLAMVAGELVLHYQPKLNMRTGDFVGAEALLRWQKEDGKFVQPGDFLPYIEQHPFAIEIGNYVIESALSQLDQWQQSGLNVAVSVNVSAVQLLADDFVETLTAQLARHPNIDPCRLELEILESAAIGKIDAAARVIERCNAVGVHVSLDDFGTGYAALDYLKRLPAQTLKIDQSFVRDMGKDDADMTIVRGIIGLASAFGFNVIAEGVEKPEQGRMLVELGCDVGQGYGIARPMPADQLHSWISTWNCPPQWRFDH